jgi:uncharacterized protein
MDGGCVRLTGIIWKEVFRNKIVAKHGVTTGEAEEVLFRYPFVVRIARGNVKGEDIYEAFGRARGGRCLVVFFVFKKGMALPISARDMTQSEKRYYERQPKTKR